MVPEQTGAVAALTSVEPLALGLRNEDLEENFGLSGLPLGGPLLTKILFAPYLPHQ